MATRETIRQYHDHRDGVISTLNRARPHLNYGYPDAWPELQLFRQELSERLQAFQAFTHRELFDPLISARSSQAEIGQQLKTDCIKLEADYSDFQHRWPKADVETRWPEYRLSAIFMMTTIRTIIAGQDEIVRKLEILVDSGRS